MSKRLLVERKFLADGLGISEQRIYQLIDDGVLPKPRNAKFDLLRCVRGYVDFVRTSAKQTPNKTTIEEENIRKLRVDNDEREFDFANKRGEFVPLSIIEEYFDVVIPQWGSKIAAVKTRLKSFLNQNPTKEKAHAYVDQCCQEILLEIGSTRPADFIDPTKAEIAIAETANEVQRMGRQVSKAVKRVKQRGGTVLDSKSAVPA